MRTPVRRKFLARLQREITKRGVIDVLRKGLKHEKHDLALFYGTPSPGNAKAKALFASLACQRAVSGERSSDSSNDSTGSGKGCLEPWSSSSSSLRLESEFIGGRRFAIGRDCGGDWRRVLPFVGQISRTPPRPLSHPPELHCDESPMPPSPSPVKADASLLEEVERQHFVCSAPTGQLAHRGKLRRRKNPQFGTEHAPKPDEKARHRPRVDLNSKGSPMKCKLSPRPHVKPHLMSSSRRSSARLRCKWVGSRH